MDTHLQKKLEECIAKQKRVLSEMDTLKEIIIRTFADYLPRWNASCVNKARESHPQAVTKLAADTIRILKQELAELDSHAQDMASRALSNSNLWMHSATGGRSNYDRFEAPKKFREGITSKVRESLREVSRLLETYGFRPDPCADFSLPSVLSDPVKRYCDLIDKLDMADGELAAAKHAVAKSAADEAWNRA